MKKFLFLLFIGLSLFSCQNKRAEQKEMSSAQIEKKTSSGVVLVKVEYFYSITFGQGNPFYFSGLDENGEIQGLTANPEEASTMLAFGTGFFVSKDGIIATNAHVASPSIAPQQVRSGITDALNFVANNFQEQINQLNSDIGELQFAINSNNYSNTDELIEKYRQKVQERDMMQEFVNNVHSINASDYDVTLHSSIGIALNNTFATNTTDFRPCVLIGKDEEHDLALLQLKDKKTPENCYVFRVQNNRPQAAGNKKSRLRRASRDEGENYTSLTGKKVYLVGFNLGPTLALTSEGIKAQVTSGEISQDTDKDIVMYTIPTLHGSSGAPVVNAQGRLIAINFAGLDETQSFNYGIKVHHLVNLLEHTTGI